ncbi:dual specificity protein phosphatase 19 [Anaeramoeba ignava]|uniref:Dual specificity protein phosphatase 19 n=1 Tax=Anaeramoeba ignava TaxID=1746090 RepID=A0A9Q0LFP4_ANAIG|nr:dual specificity protein phosphatase 19 [Anaeramoeba ignava]
MEAIRKFDKTKLKNVIMEVKNFEYIEDFTIDNQAINIFPGLFISSLTGAQNVETLKENKITHILTLIPWKINIPKDLNIQNKKIKMYDTEEYDLLSTLPEALDYIEYVIENKGNVLVHCHAGVSRSGSVVIAAIMKMKKIPFEEAYKFAKEKRQSIQPNPHFIKQLQIFSKSLAN